MSKLPQPDGCRCTALFWRIMQVHAKKECPHMKAPYPGSTSAVAQGCTCPEKQNIKGEGVLLRGQHFFFVSGICSLHGRQP